MRKISRRRLSKTVVALLQEHPTDHARIMRMLAAYLIVHKQHKQVDLVLKDIATELQASAGHLYVQVASAFPLDARSQTELEAYLKRATQATSVELSQQVEADLLAGMIVRTPELELDTSAATRLRQLRSLRLNMTEKA